MSDLGHGIYDKGILKNLLENIRNLIKNTGWSLEQDFNVLSISQDDRQKIISMMNNSNN